MVEHKHGTNSKSKKYVVKKEIKETENYRSVNKVVDMVQVGSDRIPITPRPYRHWT